MRAVLNQNISQETAFIELTLFIGMIALTQNMTQFTVTMIWTQILTGFYGLAIEVIIVPALLIGLRSLLIREKDND